MVRNVVALDLATKTGWAIGDIDAGPAPTPLERRAGSPRPMYLSGVQRIGREGCDLGEFGASFYNWFDGILCVHAPQFVTYEAAIIRPGKTSVDTAMKLMGLAFIVPTMCRLRGINSLPAHIGQIKKHATGNGHADKPAMKRAAAIRFGMTIIDDNHADALWQVDYAIALTRSGERMKPARTAAAAPVVF